MAKISILGTGGFGVSLAATCFRYGHEVTLWGLFQQEVDAIIRDGEHKKLLPGVPVNPGIRVTSDISETAGADLAILACAKQRRVCARSFRPKRLWSMSRKALRREAASC